MSNPPKRPDILSRTWGPTEVYAAAGVSRGVAHTWLARKLIPIGPAPGMGRERRFSFQEAMLVAIVAEMTRLGLSVGAASYAAETLVNDERFRERALTEDGWFIVLGLSPAPAGVDAPRLAPRALFKAATLAKVGAAVGKHLGNPSSFFVVNLTEVRSRVLRSLEGAQSEDAGEASFP